MLQVIISVKYLDNAVTVVANKGYSVPKILKISDIYAATAYDMLMPIIEHTLFQQIDS